MKMVVAADDAMLINDVFGFIISKVSKSKSNKHFEEI